MNKLITPFGEIEIKIDGHTVEYDAKEKKNSEILCPDLLGRYSIFIDFPCDGKEHKISCTFTTCNSFECSPETGERLESMGFYKQDGFKMSIGLEGEIWEAANQLYPLNISMITTLII